MSEADRELLRDVRPMIPTVTDELLEALERIERFASLQRQSETLRVIRRIATEAITNAQGQKVKA